MSTPVFDVDLALRTVLIVDDEALIREMLIRVCELRGWDGHAAATVQEAQAILETKSVGVAVIDKNLPGVVSGLDLTRTIRERSPFTQCLIITGYSSTRSAVDALRMGARDYIAKPFEIEAIMAKMSAAFDGLRAALERDQLASNAEALFETVPGFVCFVTEKGVFRRINQRGAELLGYAAGDLVGRPFESILCETPPDDDALWAFREQRAGERATRRKLVRVKTADGAERFLEIYSAGAYHHDGSDSPLFWGTVGVGHDVTVQVREQKQRARAQKMEALGHLAGGIAHDFNNMLTVILNNAQLALLGHASGDLQREDIEQITVAAQRAATLTSQLLAFSRDEALARRPLELRGLIVDMRDTIERLLRHDIQLVVDGAGPPAFVEADEAQLQQVVLNLITNARDAMPEGGRLTIGVSTHSHGVGEVGSPDLSPGDYVQLTVTDTGAGVPVEIRDRIFDPFFTTKDAATGTGLGLATVYGIVRHSGGDVDVVSEAGRGASFRVFLPVTGRRPDPSEREAAGEGAPRSAPSVRVLVVEDDEMIRRVVRRVLGRAGCKVTEAENGHDALEIFQREDLRFDVLVTDMVMPEVGGIELLRRLRELSPDLAAVFVSGYVGAGGQSPATIPGASFIHKPFNVQDLVREVMRMAGER